MEQIQFEYFRGMEAEQYSFYRVPKVLFTAECLPIAIDPGRVWENAQERFPQNERWEACPGQ